MIALNADTAQRQLWKTTVSLPFIDTLQVAGDRLVAGDFDGVEVLQASTGKSLWNFHRTFDPHSDVFVKPIVNDQSVYFTIGTTSGTYLYALRLSDGAILWQYRTHYIARVAVGPDNTIYVSSGGGDMDVTTLEALQASDGRHLWTYPTSIAASNLMAVDGALYFEDENGLYAVRSHDGKLLWKTPQEDVLEGMINGVLYAWLDESTFGTLRGSDGKILWQIHLDDWLSDLTVANGFSWRWDIPRDAAAQLSLSLSR